MDIRKAHNQFLRECQDGTLKDRSSATIKNYEISFRLFLQWFPVQNVSDLHEGLLFQFINRGKKERNWKPRTIVSHRKNLSPFFGWCVKKEYLEKNPFDEIPFPRLTKRLPEYYTNEEIDVILTEIQMQAYSKFERARNLAMFAVLLLTGLRKGELINLKIRDVDFDEECVRMRAETSKSRRPRVIKMTYRLKEVLDDYWKARQERGVNSNYFWISSTHSGPFTAHGLDHLVKRLSQQTGIRIKLHKFRHTFSTRFYEGCQDILLLQQILGHQDINTTTIYSHVIPENSKKSLDKNPLNDVF